jgi:hypothetical protein
MMQNTLAPLLKLDPAAQLFMKINSKQMEDVESYNVIGEVTGSLNFLMSL